MTIHTFTIFIDGNDKVCGHLFEVTRAEAQEIVGNMNKEGQKKYYYMEGYFD